MDQMNEAHIVPKKKLNEAHRFNLKSVGEKQNGKKIKINLTYGK